MMRMSMMADLAALLNKMEVGDVAFEEGDPLYIEDVKEAMHIAIHRAATQRKILNDHESDVNVLISTIANMMALESVEKANDE